MHLLLHVGHQRMQIEAGLVQRAGDHADRVAALQVQVLPRLALRHLFGQPLDALQRRHQLVFQPAPHGQQRQQAGHGGPGQCRAAQPGAGEQPRPDQAQHQQGRRSRQAVGSQQRAEPGQRAGAHHQAAMETPAPGLAVAEPGVQGLGLLDVGALGPVRTDR
jgi:hypothetical protein